MAKVDSWAKYIVKIIDRKTGNIIVSETGNVRTVDDLSKLHQQAFSKCPNPTWSIFYDVASELVAVYGAYE